MLEGMPWMTGLDDGPLLRGAGILGAFLLVTCVTRGFGLGNCSTSSESPHSAQWRCHSTEAGVCWWQVAGDGASLAVAAAPSAGPSVSAVCVEHQDLTPICPPLSRWQLLWVQISS